MPASGLFVGFQLWAADEDHHMRLAVVIVLPAALVIPVFLMLAKRAEDLPLAGLFFVAACADMTVAVVPCSSLLRRNFWNLEGAKLGAALALLTCATSLAGFAVGAAIVFGVLASLPRHCC